MGHVGDLGGVEASLAFGLGCQIAEEDILTRSTRHTVFRHIGTAHQTEMMLEWLPLVFMTFYKVQQKYTS
jgi:hypothetical protein